MYIYAESNVIRICRSCWACHFSPGTVFHGCQVSGGDAHSSSRSIQLRSAWWATRERQIIPSQLTLSTSNWTYRSHLPQYSIPSSSKTMQMRQSLANSPPSFLVWDMLQDTRLDFGNLTSQPTVQSLLTCVKILQRIYKYGGQPFVRDYLALHHGNKFDTAFGKGTGKAIMHATAGRWEEWTEILEELDLTVIVKFDRNRGNRPITSGRTQNQAPDESRSV